MYSIDIYKLYDLRYVFILPSWDVIRELSFFFFFSMQVKYFKINYGTLVKYT